MRILVTGAQGMLGSDLMRTLPSADTAGFSSRQLDVTDWEQVRRGFSERRPELVIHVAAYTDVDGCELNPERAYRVNGLGSRNVAQAAAEVGAALVYISTDYVFDGTQDDAYTEFDPVCPINVYGKSKLAGELFVRELCRQHYIVRTSWLFGKNGANFVQKILHLARQQEEIRVVSDQRGSPTYTYHLARKIPEIVAARRFGTYHVTNSGSCSRLQFAQAVVQKQGSRARVVPVSTSDYPVPAARPRNSVLRNFVLQLEGIELLPYWQDALSDYLAELS